MISNADNNLGTRKKKTHGFLNDMMEYYPSMPVWTLVFLDNWAFSFWRAHSSSSPVVGITLSEQQLTDFATRLLVWHSAHSITVNSSVSKLERIPSRPHSCHDLQRNRQASICRSFSEASSTRSCQKALFMQGVPYESQCLAIMLG